MGIHHIFYDESFQKSGQNPTLWTESKFISSLGCVTLEVVKKYIDEQRTV